MISAALDPNELDRLTALLNLRILDTDPEACFDGLVKSAAAATNAPVALISLVDENRQWFKSRHGLDVAETPRDVAFCSHAILQDEPLVIDNAEQDPRFFDNPLVTGAPFVKSYAGAPLKDQDGYRLGTLCIIDHKSRKWSQNDINLIRSLSEVASTLLSDRKSRLELADELELNRDRVFYVYETLGRNR